MRKFLFGSLTICFLVSFSGVTGCKEKSLTQQVSVLEAGLYGRLTQEGAAVRVAADQASYAATFEELHSGLLPLPKPPEVDFGRSTVIFVILDQKPTAGWALNLKDVALSKDRLKLVLGIDRPQPGIMTAQVLTRPFLILKMSKEKFSSLIAQTSDGQTIATWSRTGLR